ncbi:MAG TPA: hypothetical protein VF576_03265, partial [Rubricoccaceae bacterium]
MSRFSQIVSLGLLVGLVLPAQAGAQPQDDGVRAETRVDQARAEYGVVGAGVLVAILDRGIDYEHPDFRNADGTTRIRYIYDMLD